MKSDECVFSVLFPAAALCLYLGNVDKHRRVHTHTCARTLTLRVSVLHFTSRHCFCRRLCQCSERSCPSLPCLVANGYVKKTLGKPKFQHEQPKRCEASFDNNPHLILLFLGLLCCDLIWFDSTCSPCSVSRFLLQAILRWHYFERQRWIPRSKASLGSVGAAAVGSVDSAVGAALTARVCV